MHARHTLSICFTSCCKTYMVRITYYLMLQLITKSAFTVPTHALCGIYNRAFHLREWGVNYSTHQLTVCTTLPSFLGDKYSLKAWQPLQIGDSFAIEASNRYFSWKGSNGIQQPVSFSDMVNPNKVLAGLAGTEYIHTQENEVDYMTCKITEDRKNKYVTMRILMLGLMVVKIRG